MEVRTTLAQADKLDRHAARLLGLRFLPAAVEPLLLWLEANGESDAEAASRIWNRLGMVYAAQNELEMALEAFQRAAALLGDNPGVAGTGVRVNLSRCYRILGDFPATESVARDAVANLPADCPANVRSGALLTWANALTCLDRTAEACEVLEQALLLNRQRQDHHSIAMTLNNLGIAAMEAGLFDRAEQALTEACNLFLDVGHPMLPLNYTELGRLYQLMDRPAAALQAANRALEALVQDVSLLDRAELARLSELNGRVFLQEGDRKAALQHLNRAAAYFAQLGMMREWDRCKEAIRQGMSLRSAGLREYRVPGVRDRLDFLTRVLDLVDEVETLVPYLQGHGARVAAYAGQMGRQLGLVNGDVSALKLAARLHHVGLVAASNQSLITPPTDMATRVKWAEQSLALAEPILRGLQVDEDVLAAVHYQHAAFDGSGFPTGTSGQDIPLLARIICVANAYDALTTNRPYRSALPHSEAMATITAQAGHRFCPTAVTALVELVS